MKPVQPSCQFTGDAFGPSEPQSSNEYRLLGVLVKNADKVMTHRQLLHEVWGSGSGQESHYLRVYMNQLRQKIEPDPARPRFLLTETGVGYRFRLTS